MKLINKKNRKCITVKRENFKKSNSILRTKAINNLNDYVYLKRNPLQLTIDYFLVLELHQLKRYKNKFSREKIISMFQIARRSVKNHISCIENMKYSI